MSNTQVKVVKRDTLVKQLTRFSTKFLKENYGLDMAIPIKVDGRLTRALGKFKYIGTYNYSTNEYDYRAKEIKLAKYLIERYDKDTVKQVLIHELIHYALYELGLPNSDGDEIFEREIKKHGSHSTGTLMGRGDLYKYTCECNKNFYQKRKDGHNYVCNNCNGRLKFDSKVVRHPKLVEVK